MSIERRIYRYLLMALLWILSQIAYGACDRIVSISPAATDLLLSEGLGDQLIGATRYCHLPESHNAVNVGGYFDLNLEQVHRLKPALIVMQGDENQLLYRDLTKMGYQVLALNLDRYASIMESRQTLATLCDLNFDEDLADRAEHPADDHNELTPFKGGRALIFYGKGDDYHDRPPEMAAGPSFHSDILSQLGLKNAYQGPLNAPTLSAEALYQLNPEWIFIFEAGRRGTFTDRYQLKVRPITVEWGIINRIDAVVNRRIFIVEGFATQIPSPEAVSHLIQTMSTIIKEHQ